MHNAIVHNLPEHGTVQVDDRHPRRSPSRSPSRTPATRSRPQLVSTLTEPFQRGTERIRSDHAGVGLGLAIVKSIAEAHDGTLTSSPAPPAGSASRCSSRPSRATP